ncbi:hypothetical protein [Actinomadura chibensis]|uniref:Uncharacterized protein n=1 Tax=Actinomadura chibensis TaxID=392828 RepID=A0A5D0NHP5_9ACTN|nr:hypothetical protein [Actinomadura chibensis]TYB43957.1 hypothetical protein FXF69_23620 [Actinomadura chibensis]
MDQFEVPEDAEILDVLGVEPELSASEEMTRIVRLPGGEGESLTLSYDIPGRSVRLQLQRQQELLLDLFREGAERLRLRSDAKSTAIEVDFQTESTRGTLDIQVRPAILIKDRTLLA